MPWLFGLTCLREFGSVPCAFAAVRLPCVPCRVAARGRGHGTGHSAFRACRRGGARRAGRALCLQDPAPRRRPACCALSVPSGPSGAVCEHHLLSTHRHAQVVGDAVARRSGRVCDSGESRFSARDACTVAIATIQPHCLYETHDRVRWTSFALARDGELRSTPASAPTPVAAVGSTTCTNRQSAASRLHSAGMLGTVTRNVSHAHTSSVRRGCCSCR